MFIYYLICIFISLGHDVYTLHHASLPPSSHNLDSRQNTTLGTSKVNLLFDKTKLFSTYIDIETKMHHMKQTTNYASFAKKMSY